jgi:hypothetical protein
MADKFNERIKQNAQKFAYLVEVYSEKTLPEIISLFQMGPIDINTAIWAAVDLGYISDMDQEDQHAHFIADGLTWSFGPEIEYLKEALTYAFEKLNEQEKDMEENYLSNWLGGHSAHDTLIAVKLLLEDGTLHEYEIEDGENSYIFYTLKKNEGKNWGQKQFKINPLTDEPNEVADAPDAPDTTE